jgi:hypothetical protein
MSEGSVAISEGRRNRLHNKFREVLGEDDAETVMEMLPPVGWADVATNRELDHLRVELEARMEASEQRMLAALHREIGAVRDEIGSVTRSVMVWATGLFATLAGLAFTAGHLL